METVNYNPANDEMPSTAVVQAVAIELDESSTGNLDQNLADTVDTQGLNRLFSPTNSGSPARTENGKVRFRFCECIVTIHAHGTVIAESDPANSK
jgi:hypothetical protein